MPNYMITDNQTGAKFKVTGDSPPTDAEMIQIIKDTKGIRPPITVDVPVHNSTVEFPFGTPSHVIQAAMQKQWPGTLGNQSGGSMTNTKTRDILKNPDFIGLPAGEKAKFLRQYVPGYAALPIQEQAKFMGYLTGDSDNADSSQYVGGNFAVGSPEHRKAMEQFIRSEGKRDLKQEAVRGLPMGNTIADAAIGKYVDPVHPERTVNDLMGSETKSRYIPTAALHGVGNLATNPAPQVEGMLKAPFVMAYGASEAQTKGKLGEYAFDALKGLVAPVGGADVVNVATGKQNISTLNPFAENSYPETRDAWEHNALGSTAAVVGLSRGLKPLSSARQAAGTIAAKSVSTVLNPEKMYGSSLKQSTKLPPNQRTANIKTGLEGEYLPNKSGLDKLHQDIEGINRKIAMAIDEVKTTGKTADVETIINYLEPIKQKAIDSFGDNQPVLRSLEGFADSLRNHPAVVDGQVPLDLLQSMKVNTYQQIRGSYGEMKGFEIEGKKALARGAKDELARQIPELKILNADDSSLINLEREIFRAANRINNRDLVGIGVPIKIAAGAKGGIGGAMFGALAGILDTPAVKAKIAVALHKASNRKLSMPDALKSVDAKVAGMLAPVAAMSGNEAEQVPQYSPEEVTAELRRRGYFPAE